MNVLLATSEAVPFAKTGGLADVMYSLPRALKSLGHHPVVILPRYRTAKKLPMELFLSEIPVPISDRYENASVYRSTLNSNIPVYLIDKPEYFDRENLYRGPEGDYHDNAERFIFFSRAIIEILPRLPERPHIVHCNDWQTGLVPLYIKLRRQSDNYFSEIRTLFTIHNLAYQGLFWRFDMHLTGLSWDFFIPEGIEYYGDINLMKAGLVYADALNTVSPQYCRDIQTAEYGCGLDGVLRSRSKSLHGILNGIDYEIWDPSSDPLIPANFSSVDLSGKSECKKSLLEELNLAGQNDVPLLGVITRLSNQKGLDLISQAMRELMSRELNFVLLGTGDRSYEEEFEFWQKTFPDKFAFVNGFDDDLAHRIEAGADIFLMPSRYEPCGLNQLYSLRYGTIPVVRSTGGLHDTVTDVNDMEEKGTGFKFREYSPQAMIRCIDRALTYRKKADRWTALMKRAMEQDFSWKVAAAGYIDLYRKLLT